MMCMLIVCKEYLIMTTIMISLKNLRLKFCSLLNVFMSQISCMDAGLVSGVINTMDIVIVIQLCYSSVRVENVVE